MGLDLRKLEHLVAVSEEKSFTRAAERLHLSQQALSTSIRALEREVGVQLLLREQNGVVPSASGDALIEDARLLRGAATTALRRARRIGRGEPERIRVGHTPAVTGEEITQLLRDRLGEAVETEVHQRYPNQLTEDLLAGDLEVGLNRGMRPPRGLIRTTLTRHRLAVAVAADHRLADRHQLELKELADERFVIWGRPGQSGYTDLLFDHCRDAGFEPRFIRNPIQGTPPVTAVVGGSDVAFVTAAPGSAADGKARVLELTPEIHAPLHALSSPHSRSAALETLLASDF